MLVFLFLRLFFSCQEGIDLAAHPVPEIPVMEFRALYFGHDPAFLLFLIIENLCVFVFLSGFRERILPDRVFKNGLIYCKGNILGKRIPVHHLCDHTPEIGLLFLHIPGQAGLYCLSVRLIAQISDGKAQDHFALLHQDDFAVEKGLYKAVRHFGRGFSRHAPAIHTRLFQKAHAVLF